ncbi:MAG: rhomboid family intramembrane serine protease [Bacteroidetes bacterium 4572_77]|nr:MAG: rhomboid family intramembrane serine protease [Bacteroidetes bacterium 4572_77]
MNQQFRRGGFSILPPVVKNLLIINGLFFLATIGLGQAFNIDLIKLLGLHYVGASDFQPYQYITYMFMHSATNYAHILFNMLALWMFGNTLENVWGSKRFLIYYLVTGIGAAVVYTFWIHYEIMPTIRAVDHFLDNPSMTAFAQFRNSDFFQVASYDIQNNFNAFVDSYNRLSKTDQNAALQETINFMSQYKQDYMNAHTVVGASGAVYGILLAFGMMFPNQIIYLYFAIPIKAKWFVIIFGALELYSGISNKPGDNVAHFAHLGGMLFGFLIIKYWKKKGRLY